MQQLIPRQSRHEPVHRSGCARISQYKTDGRRDTVIRFRRYWVLPRRRQLLVDGRPVDLGGRAFDLLIVLLDAAGALVTKTEIMSRVWPSTVVDEGNLKVQMSALRKVLSEDRDVIKTVHGRGYVFTGEVTTAPTEPSTATVRWGMAPRSLCAKSLPQRRKPAAISR